LDRRARLIARCVLGRGADRMRPARRLLGVPLVRYRCAVAGAYDLAVYVDAEAGNCDVVAGLHVDGDDPGDDAAVAGTGDRYGWRSRVRRRWWDRAATHADDDRGRARRVASRVVGARDQRGAASRQRRRIPAERVRCGYVAGQQRAADQKIDARDTD